MTSATEPFLIVGLGNPGERYVSTRHNVGFEVISALLEKHGVAEHGVAEHGVAEHRAIASSTFDEIEIGGCRVFLLRPGTFMNRSGGPTQSAISEIGCTEDRMLVISDDLDLPPGRIRLRGRGSSGGHRGVEDILQRTGWSRFARLRMGIGRPNPGGDAAAAPQPIEEFVLDRWSQAEQPAYAAAIGLAAAACEDWVSLGLQRAMDLYNAAPSSPNTGARNQKPDSSPSRRGQPGAELTGAHGHQGKEPEGAMVKLYEGMFLFDANESARRWSELEDRVGAIFKKNGAEVRFAERWPDQRLSFEIQGARKGTYYLTYFDAEGENIQSIRRDAELSEDILRVLIIQEQGLDEEMASRQEAAARRAAAPPPPKVEEASATEGAPADGAATTDAATTDAATADAATTDAATTDAATTDAATTDVTADTDEVAAAEPNVAEDSSPEEKPEE